MILISNKASRGRSYDHEANLHEQVDHLTLLLGLLHNLVCTFCCLFVFFFFLVKFFSLGFLLNLVVCVACGKWVDLRMACLCWGWIWIRIPFGCIGICFFRWVGNGCLSILNKSSRKELRLSNQEQIDAIVRVFG